MDERESKREARRKQRDRAGSAVREPAGRPPADTPDDHSINKLAATVV